MLNHLIVEKYKLMNATKFYITATIAFSFCNTGALIAQKHTEWLTGIKDTSYTSHSDYIKNLKKYPFIELVPDSSFSSVLEKRDITYTRTTNRELKLDAFIPKKTLKQTPAIIIIHGGGWRSGDRSQHIPLAQHLANNGFACFTVEYTLSTEAFFPEAIYNLKNAVQWLRSHAKEFNVDRNKITALGFSAGGELAAFIGLTNGIKKFEGAKGNTKYSSNINAVIDIDGTLSFVHPEASETKNPTKVGASAWWLGYPRTENYALWEEASPLTYAKNNKIPFLFLNSSLERMHAGRDDFKNLMNKKNLYVQIKEFKDTPHSFCLYRPWFEEVIKEITNFINKVYN